MAENYTTNYTISSEDLGKVLDALDRACDRQAELERQAEARDRESQPN